MSFSKSFRGSATIVLAAIAAFPSEQRTLDTGCSAGVIDGHQKQIAAGAAVLTPAISATPEGAEITATIWGHANPDESGSFGFTLQVSGLTTPSIGAVGEDGG